MDDLIIEMNKLKHRLLKRGTVETLKWPDFRKHGAIKAAVIYRTEKRVFHPSDAVGRGMAKI